MPLTENEASIGIYTVRAKFVLRSVQVSATVVDAVVVLRSD
jgi:hypothetical protein